MPHSREEGHNCSLEARAAADRHGLAEKLHHTSRGQRIAGAREKEENEMNFAMGQMTPIPRAAAAEY